MTTRHHLTRGFTCLAQCVLQCVAVCCSVLQLLQRLAVFYQASLDTRLHVPSPVCVAVCCSVLQLLQRLAVFYQASTRHHLTRSSICLAQCVLQCVAVCCSCCSLLQYSKRHHLTRGFTCLAPSAPAIPPPPSPPATPPSFFTPAIPPTLRFRTSTAFFSAPAPIAPRLETLSKVRLSMCNTTHQHMTHSCRK